MQTASALKLLHWASTVQLLPSSAMAEHWPATQVSPLGQPMHAAPLLPQAPGPWRATDRQVLPLQQPWVQLPAAHVDGPTHSPAVQVLPVTHSLHTAPALPQV